MIVPRTTQPAPIEVVCFPYAGSGAAAFGPWLRGCPAGVGLILAQLAGRDGRRGEPCAETAQQVADGMAAALLELEPKPRILFGYSMGALIAFETARRLEAAGRSPLALVVAARRAPTRPERAPRMAHLPMDAFVHEVQQRYGGIPAAVLAEPELRDLFLPTLRADIALVERYDFAGGAPLTCPIHAYGGADDPNATLDDLNDWALQTATPGTVRQFAGGHFFLQSAAADVLAALLSDAARASA